MSDCKKAHVFLKIVKETWQRDHTVSIESYEILTNEW